MKGLSFILALIYAVLIVLLLLLNRTPAPEVHEATIVVVDALTDKPIKGAKVKIKTTDEQCPSTTLTTDRDGQCTFEFTDPDEQLTIATATKQGYHDAELEEAIDLAYFLDDELTIPMEKEDPVSEGREIGAQGDLKVTLLWDNDSVDLDLHILEPNGFEICYKDGQRSDPRTGGELDIDWIPGNNAGQPIGENIYWQHPPKGQYKVWVECYQPETAPPTSCNVIVYRVNQEPRVYNAQTQCVHDVQQITTITVE